MLVVNNVAEVARATNSGYSCIPPLPNGVVLYNNGSLSSYPNILQSSSDGEYICTSTEFNGSVVIGLSVIGESVCGWLFSMYCCDNMSGHSVK